MVCRIQTGAEGSCAKGSKQIMQNLFCSRTYLEPDMIIFKRGSSFKSGQHIIQNQEILLLNWKKHAHISFGRKIPL